MTKLLSKPISINSLGTKRASQVTLGRPLDPTHGGNVNVLIPNDRDFDPYSGMPRMSNIPVTLSAVR
jgi:hypothetical protein